MTDITACDVCSQAGLLTCTCDYYRDWPTDSPTIRPWMGRNATLFAFGHRSGRTDCARRLWKHLDPEGRQLAAVIAAE
ncbi:hypothetical protein EI067_22915 [Mycobacterium paragordonae]|uniref:hypothetical protein n=1 Tax=Mycobacterium paragordonae TaxID=1389713 RepID=UPI00105DAE15|nr:hypothetical protein [Mycobacterium paragordonae]TDK91554.1 hypothetical protein EI067_22915 [Mycobacterium paragordonae]